MLPRPGRVVAQLTPTFQPGSAGTEDTGARRPEHHRYGHHQADADRGTDIEGGPEGPPQTPTSLAMPLEMQEIKVLRCSSVSASLGRGGQGRCSLPPTFQAVSPGHIWPTCGSHYGPPGLRGYFYPPDGGGVGEGVSGRQVHTHPHSTHTRLEPTAPTCPSG